MNIVEIEDEVVEEAKLPEKITLADSLSMLTRSANDIVADVVSEYNPDKVKDLTNLFNLNQSKKNLIRTATYSELLDKVTNQMQVRLDSQPDVFTNKELVEYMNVINSAMKESSAFAEELNSTAPMVAKNMQVNINVGSPELDRESRNRVLDAVRQVMELSKSFQGEEVVYETKE